MENGTKNCILFGLKLEEIWILDHGKKIKNEWRQGMELWSYGENNAKAKWQKVHTRNRTVFRFTWARFLLKRCVSVNYMAPPDWLPGAGNRNLKTKRGNLDQTKTWTCSWAFIQILHSRNSSRTIIHETWQIIHRWTCLIKHNNNINMLWPNSKYPARIDQKKI